jgi:hypothetical protein
MLGRLRALSIFPDAGNLCGGLIQRYGMTRLAGGVFAALREISKSCRDRVLSALNS